MAKEDHQRRRARETAETEMKVMKAENGTEAGVEALERETETRKIGEAQGKVQESQKDLTAVSLFLLRQDEKFKTASSQFINQNEYYKNRNIIMIKISSACF